MRRHYPGFFGASFLILLRIAIGWHFLYEGMEKINPSHGGGKPFTAEPYLRNATGPLGPQFRAMIPDVNGLATLDQSRLFPSWEVEVDRIAQHYSFEREQRELAQKGLREAQADALPWFQDATETEKRSKYLRELRDVQTIERNADALSFERERAAARRKDLDVDRKALIAPLDAIASALRDSTIRLATPDQRENAGPYTRPWTALDWVNLSTKWGLIAMGLGLMLGLFTPLAALAGAVFLGQIYLSMPPWPGLPASPVAEGHYFVVNKNLIEMLACLALASIPTGMWVGLDALLFGWIGRRRQRAAVLADSSVDHTRANHAQPAGTKPVSH